MITFIDFWLFVFCLLIDVGLFLLNICVFCCELRVVFCVVCCVDWTGLLVYCLCFMVDVRPFDLGCMFL